MKIILCFETLIKLLNGLRVISKKITISDIENKSGFTKAYFQRQFSALTGITISKYIRRRKLSLSAWELITTCKSISYISKEYNVGTIQSFSRNFKLKFGIISSQYRKHFKTNFKYHQCSLTKDTPHFTFKVKEIHLRGSSTFRSPQNALLDAYGYPIFSYVNKIKRSALIESDYDTCWIVEFKNPQSKCRVNVHPVIGGGVTDSNESCTAPIISKGVYAVFEFSLAEFNIYIIIQFVYLTLINKMNVDRSIGDDILIRRTNKDGVKNKIIYMVPKVTS